MLAEMTLCFLFVWWYAVRMGSGTPNRVLWLLIELIFLVMGPLFLARALISAHNTQQFLRRSVTVQGRIVALKPVRNMRRHSVTYAPVFRFAVENWHLATVVSNTSSNPPAFKPGQVIMVHYEKDHPERARIDSFEQLWRGDWVIGSVGALFTGIGLSLLVYGRRGKRRDLALSDSGCGITRFE